MALRCRSGLAAWEGEVSFYSFKTVISELEQILPDIKNTRWKKKTDFYSLFVLLSENENILPLSEEQRSSIRERLDAFSAGVSAALSTSGEAGSGISTDIKSYASAIRASSDIGNRKRRHIALASAIGEIISDRKDDKSPKIQPMQDGLFDDSLPEEHA